MASYALNSLKKINVCMKYYNPINISKLFSSNIVEMERKWNDTGQVPEYFNFYQHAIKYWALKERNSERIGQPALWYIDKNYNSTKWNFQELVKQTEKTAAVLKSCGLQKSDRMIVILPKIPEWCLIELASFQLGIISVPGTNQLRSNDILYRINAIQAKCVVADFETSERVDTIAESCPTLSVKILYSENKKELKDDWLDFRSMHENSSPFEECIKTKMTDPVMIYFTSGSTGKPKAVQHSQEHCFGACVSRQYFLDLHSKSLMWSLTDAGWAKTLWGSMFIPWSAGSGNFIFQFLHFDPKLCLQILQDYPITNFCAPPTAFKLMVKEDLEKYKFPYLKQCASGGESLTKDLYITWKEKTGLEIYEGYGQTETPLLCADYHCKKKPGSIGLPPKKLLNLVIINEKYEELKPFQEGDIAIKIKPNYPLGLFKEYMNNPEKTGEVFKKDYYLTGDRGYKDDDGYLWFIGRNDDIISSAGYRIGPYEVESALQEHPAVKECAAVSSPDPLRGEIVKAFIILTKEYLEVNKDELIKELQNHAKNVTSPYKYPRKIEFVEDLPRTISGKVQRFKLRQQEMSK